MPPESIPQEHPLTCAAPPFPELKTGSTRSGFDQKTFSKSRVICIAGPVDHFAIAPTLVRQGDRRITLSTMTLLR